MRHWHSRFSLFARAYMLIISAKSISTTTPTVLTVKRSRPEARPLMKPSSLSNMSSDTWRTFTAMSSLRFSLSHTSVPHLIRLLE